MTVPRQPIWTPPPVWDEDTPLDEVNLNTYVRNNLLFLKTGQLNILTSRGSNISTTSSTMSSAGLSVELTIQRQSHLTLGFSLPLGHTSGAATIDIDFFAANGGYFISSGTATPASLGVRRTRRFVNNTTNIVSHMIPLGYLDPGLHEYTLYWATSASTATIARAVHPVQLWLWAH